MIEKDGFPLIVEDGRAEKISAVLMCRFQTTKDISDMISVEFSENI